MRLFVSFSGKENGNCDQIARFLCREQDKVACFRKLDIHGCCNCEYECFYDVCKYHRDDVHSLYEIMMECERVVLIVPMYCGNPSSLYFLFNERSQDFFMSHEEVYDEFLSKLYIIGIYGSEEEYPDFIPCLNKWFIGTRYTDHVLGIERHKYDMKLQDRILEVNAVKEKILRFMKREDHDLVVESDVLTDMEYCGKYLCARFDEIQVSIMFTEDRDMMRKRIAKLEEFLVSGKYLEELSDKIPELYEEHLKKNMTTMTLEEYAKTVYISYIGIDENDLISINGNDGVNGHLGFGFKKFLVNIDEE